MQRSLAVSGEGGEWEEVSNELLWGEEEEPADSAW